MGLIFGPWTQARAATSGRAVSFGSNITEALLNPFEPGADEARLRQQIARILYDVRVTGGTTVRWMVSDVWPQWRCSLDPEDEASGSIDPAWFVITRILLEEAERQGIAVVLVLVYLNEGHFSTFKGQPEIDRALVAGWQAHRRDAKGRDRYEGSEAHRCPTVPGFFGQVDEAALFTDPALGQRLVGRFVAMADFADRFAALAALELFNEPQMELTAQPAFWSLVKRARDAIRASGDGGRAVPVLSGTASWSPEIVRQAKAAGELDREAFVTVHVYESFADGMASALARLEALVAWLRRIAPGQAIVISEAGSGPSIADAKTHGEMVDALLTLQARAGVGVWVWGGWFPQPVETDYRFDFNHRSPVGAAFRPWFFVPREDLFRMPRLVSFVDASGQGVAPRPVSIARLDEDADPYRRSRWALTVGGRRFLGFSRAGVFLKGTSSPAVPLYFVGEAGAALQWAEVVAKPAGWALRIYACEDGPGSAAGATPDALTGLASDAKREDFAACATSRLLSSADL